MRPLSASFSQFFNRLVAYASTSNVNERRRCMMIFNLVLWFKKETPEKKIEMRLDLLIIVSKKIFSRITAMYQTIFCKKWF